MPVVYDKPMCKKSYAFVLRIVKLLKWLETRGLADPLSGQILRSRASTDVNIEEAYGAYSTKEFASKMQID